MGERLEASPIAIEWRPEMPIYASEAFLRVDSERFGWIGGTTERGDLRSVLPYVVYRKAGFQMVRFRTATIPLGPELSVEAEKSFLNSVVEYFRKAGVALVLPSGNSAIFRTYPDGAAAAPYGTVIKQLQQPEEALWNEIRTSHRQNIRKAERAGIEIRHGMEYLETAYRLVGETLGRSGKSFMPYGKFKQRISALAGQVEVFVAVRGGITQGCMVAPFSQHTAYDWYAGSIVDSIRGAMALLHWESIRYFRSKGVKFFDFQGVRINPEQGSKQEGIASYKRGFGGMLVQGYSWKYSLRPLGFAAYSLAARLLMGGDVVDQERHKLAVT